MHQFDCKVMHITNLNALRRSLTYGLLTLSLSEVFAEMISVVWDTSCLDEGVVCGGVLLTVRLGSRILLHKAN